MVYSIIVMPAQSCTIHSWS